MKLNIYYYNKNKILSNKNKKIKFKFSIYKVNNLSP